MVDKDKKGFSIQQSKPRRTTKELRRGKATEEDNVPVDLLKDLG